MNIVSGIYVIRNKSNGKIYIGSSKNIRSRVNSHYSALRRGAHCNRHLQGAWDQYGENNFEDKILERCETDKLLEREQHWIKVLNVTDQSIGYNISANTTSPMLGLSMSNEIKDKISKANKGKKRSPEFCKLMSDINRGRQPTEENRRNMSIANKRRGLAHIDRLAELNKETFKKDFIVTSPDGTVYQVHGMKQFCEEHGLSRSSMCSLANGYYKGKTYKGWKCCKVDNG